MSAILAHPWTFLFASVAAVPMVIVGSAALTAIWYEHRWLPRICGED